MSLMARRKRWVPPKVGIGIVAGVLALGLAACGGGSGESGGSIPGVTKTSIKLATTSPLTGPPASGCARVHGGASAWFKHINDDEGGVDGRKIDWKILDDAYDLARAGTNTRTIVDGDYLAMFGGCGSIQPPAIVPVVTKAKMPYLFPMAQVPNLYKPLNPYTYAFSPSWATMYSSLVPWSLDHYGTGSVATLFTQNAGIDEAVTAVKDSTSKADGKFVGGEVIPATTSDYTPYVLKLKQMNPDYVVTNFSVEAALKFQQAAEDQQFEPKKKYINTISLMGDQFIEGIKIGNGPQTKLDGKVISAYQVATPDDPANKECVAAAKKYVPDLEPDGNLMAGCNSAQWMVELLKKTGPDLTRETFLKTINSINNEQLSPGAVSATINEKRHLAPSDIYVYELENGEYVNKGTVALKGDM